MAEDPRTPGEDPPGSVIPANEELDAGAESAIPTDAMSSPDDPIAETEGEIPREAIFSPDDPLRREEPLEGVVTRLDGSLDRSPDKARSLVWRVRLTADLLETLAKDLRDHGLEALRVHPKSERMDAIIRSFVAGYLVGQMEDEGEGP